MSSRLALLACACSAAFGGIYVVPNAPVDYATTAGNQPIALGSKATRIQEIVGSGQFPGALLITGLHIRAAAGKGGIIFNVPSFKVTLSTTQAYPNTNNGHALPSTTFANNIGPDATVVYNAALSSSSPGCSAPGPCNFDIGISFSTPFSYDPNKGRLLVDLLIAAPSPAPTGSLDGVLFPDFSSSSLAFLNTNDPTQPTGNLNPGGLIFGLDTSTPLISSVANAATNLVGLPNSAIAQGAIFVVKGSGLGPANISIAAAAFQNTTLSGTSVSVTMGTTTVNALMYYTSDGQVAALLPSNTPTGAGSITVVYNNQTSPPASINVVTNNLGIFTVDNTGQGPAIATYGDGSWVSPTKITNCYPNTNCGGAANPNDELVLWATGLGPVNGNDASGAGLGQNMPNIPLVLWIGGVQAQVVYQGRSGYIGEDQINFIVPNNAPTGCAVPLVVQINNQVSNTTAIPIANGSRTCTPSTPALTADEVPVLSTLNSFTVGLVELDHFLNNNGSGYFDQAQFNFVKASGVPVLSQPFLPTYFDNQPVGTCTVFTGGHSPSDTLFNSLNLALLDGGSNFTVQGPKGSMNITPQPGTPASLSTVGTFLAPGNYTITGNGGKNVGPFTANVSIPASPTLTSPSSPNFTVTRAKGFTVTWNPNGSTGHVEIVLGSNNGAASATLACTAPASAGTFSIPAYALYSLPTGNSTSFAFQLGDQAPASSSSFTATGLNAGVAQTFVDVISTGGFTIN